MGREAKTVVSIVDSRRSNASKRRAHASAPAEPAAETETPLPSADRNPNALNVPTAPDEYFPDALARAALRPTVLAAGTIRNFTKGAVPATLDLTSVITELSNQAKAVIAGDMARVETMLVAQAHALDAIFAEMARRAALNMNEHLGAAETYMRLALKAQSQCRTTLETLSEMKNPKPVAFVRQANIANGPQQVNNGIDPRAEKTSNELVEGIAHAGTALGLDARTEAPALRADSRLAAVGALDRAADDPR